MCSYARTDAHPSLMTIYVAGCAKPKLSVNGMHNGVSAASGLSGNAMRQDERIRRVIIKLGGEGVRVGQALGYKLEDIAGQNADKLARAAEGDRAALDEVESLMLALRNSQQRSEHQRPSMGQDMQKGRRTEIDFINGVIVEKGREAGIPTPTHEKLIAAVKKVELGQAAPSPEHLYAIH
jgi:2-dehydropantoate 2-reductase